jgi:hypothetical protein
MLIIFLLWHQGDCSQIICPGRQNNQFRTLVTFYGDCIKMCEDFAPNFGGKRSGCCITTTHHLTLPFSPGNFGPEITLLSSPPTILFSVSPIEDKTEGRHFDTIEVIEAESQILLNNTRGRGLLRW